MKETFKDIKCYEGYYQISNFGRVKSLPRYINYNGRKYTRKNDIILKQGITRGYYYVSIIKDNKLRSYSVHRLVANHFIPNTENKPQVNHIDGNKLNNHYTNLEWCTISENVKHAIKLGNFRNKRVIQYDLNMNYINIFESCAEVERKLKYKRQCISSCARFEIPHSYKFIWRYDQ